VRKSKINQISLAVMLALTPLSIYAAGLGKLNTQSGLGEPLRAEIEIFATPEELASLSAVIASEDAYAEQGITRLGVHSNIKVEVAKNASGAAVLKLRSSLPIKDPYLDMLIQMDWASGRLQREYTVLLDPPEYKAADVAGVSTIESPSASTSDSANVAGQSSVKKSTTKKSKKAKKQAEPVAETQDEVIADVGGADEITTKSGDTLIAIARANQVEGVSLDQMLAGLYNSNKDAFVSGNMNRLKVGKIIKVPSQESLTSISNRKARQVVKAHSSNWNAYRNTMAGAVANLPTGEDDEQKQSSSGKITTAEDKAAAAQAGPKDVVKLSAGEKDTGKAFDNKITALQEETTAQEKALKEAQDRAASLEAQIQDMQKLLALKNQSMADKQNAVTDPVANAQPEVKPQPEVVPVPEVKPADASATQPAEAAPVAEVKPVEPAPAIEPAPAVKPAPVVVPTPVAEPEAEPSFLDGLLGDNLPLIGGGLGLGLLGAGWLYLRNKRKKNLDSFERGILTSGGLRANTVFGNTTNNTSTTDTSFLTDFAQSVDGGMIDTNDVDPIAEAEVYMAYGRGAQAEEILKDAIQKEPKRYELHLKLLEIYAESKNNSAFEAIAGELYTTLGADDPTWSKVARLGATLEPDNPLYDVSKLAAVSEGASETLDQVNDENDLVFGSDEVTQKAEDNNLDFSLDSDEVLNDPFADQASASVEDAASVVADSFAPADNEIAFTSDTETFDLGDLGGTDTSQTANAIENSLQSEVSNGMDFDLGDAFDIGEPVASASVATENIADSLPSFDLPVAASTDALDAPALDLSSEFTSESLENAEQVTTAEAPALDFAMDFDFPASTETSAPASAPAVNLAEEKAAVESIGDFSFDLPDTEADNVITANESASIVSAPEAHTFDLSSINLDLDTPTLQPTASQVDDFSTEGLAPANNVGLEPQDVEIKLDLVAVYIDMDDKVGARELLEEVLKEGSVQQKQRAQTLLDSLA